MVILAECLRTNNDNSDTLNDCDCSLAKSPLSWRINSRIDHHTPVWWRHVVQLVTWPEANATDLWRRLRWLAAVSGVRLKATTSHYIGLKFADQGLHWILARSRETLFSSYNFHFQNTWRGRHIERTLHGARLHYTNVINVGKKIKKR